MLYDQNTVDAPEPMAAPLNFTTDEHGRKHWRTGPGLPVPFPDMLHKARTRRQRALKPSRVKEPDTAAERNEARAKLYCAWLAERDGVTIPAGCRTIIERDYLPNMPGERSEWRVRAVRFEHGGTPNTPTRVYGRIITRGPKGGRIAGPLHWMDNPDYEAPAVAARIEIPNWDHVATVTEETLP